MARGIWRRSGEEFSAFCLRQIVAHTQEIERCETLMKERAAAGYHGAAMFYNGKAITERAGRRQWRNQLRNALINEGQRDKNATDEFTRMVGRAKLQTVNTIYGKFATGPRTYVDAMIEAPKLNVESCFGFNFDRENK